MACHIWNFNCIVSKLPFNQFVWACIHSINIYWVLFPIGIELVLVARWWKRDTWRFPDGTWGPPLLCSEPRSRCSEGSRCVRQAAFLPGLEVPWGRWQAHDYGMCCCDSYFTRVTDKLPVVARRRTIFKFRNLGYLVEKRNICAKY